MYFVSQIWVPNKKQYKPSTPKDYMVLYILSKRGCILWWNKMCLIREQSKQLLEKAKRAVEIFIEQDEKAAMGYLKR